MSAPAPAEVTAGGPVIRLDPSGAVESRAMPGGTIALTFDDGPDPVWTPRILDLLARHQARATFFVIGSRVNEHPDLVRRILAEGHEIGVHTYTHADLEAVPGWRRSLEMTLTRSAIAGATGRQAVTMRPPYSATPAALTESSLTVLREVAADTSLVVLADHDPRDWERPGVDAMVAAATPPVGGSAVVLLHDGGGDRADTVAAVDRLLTELSPQGFQFLTVSEGMRLPSGNPEAPTGRPDPRSGARARAGGQRLARRRDDPAARRGHRRWPCCGW